MPDASLSNARNLVVLAVEGADDVIFTTKQVGSDILRHKSELSFVLFETNIANSLAIFTSS